MQSPSATISSLPPLKEVIESFGLSAKKSLGQNFLLDLNVTDKIAELAGGSSGDNFVEIGPGPGGLTRSLLKKGVKHLTVIEKDPRCIPALEQIGAAYPDRLKIICGDALKIDYQQIYDGQPYKIAANLPYNISSKILISLLTQSPWPPLWKTACLMFQKEFAERLNADIGTKAYGRLSVLCGIKAKTKKLYELHPHYFTPPPKIMSLLVSITPHNNHPDCDIKSLAAVTHACFSGRRKMIRQSLKSIFSDPISVCEQLNITPTLRAENLSISDYISLSKML